MADGRPTTIPRRMRPAAPSVAEASRSLSSVKTGEPPADDDIVTSVAYEPNDAEPVSPELALVDPLLAERLRADLSEAAPEPEPAVAAPPERVTESTPIPDPMPVEAVPAPPSAVVGVHVDPVATAEPLPTDGDPVGAPAAEPPEVPAASVHILRPAPAVEEPRVVVEPAIVPVPDPDPDRESEIVREPEPVAQVALPAALPANVARGRSSVSPLRRRSRAWHVLVLLATVVLFAGVVAVGVVVVSELTDRDRGSGLTASGDPPAAAVPQAGDEQEPGAAPAPTESSPGAPEPRRFAWAPVAGAVSYRFELFRGDEQVLRTATTTPGYELPPSWRHEGREERLTPGSYRWYVWPVLASGPADAAVVQARLDVP